MIYIIVMLFLIYVALSYFQRAYNINYFLRFELMFNRQENNMGSINIRINMIEKAIDAIISNPLFGIGYFNFVGYKNDTYFNFLSHNDYLLIFAEFGIIGIFVYLLLLLCILNKAYNNFKKNSNSMNLVNLISIITIIIYLNFINAYDNIIIWLIFGLIKAEYIRQNDKRSKKTLI